MIEMKSWKWKEGGGGDFEKGWFLKIQPSIVGVAHFDQQRREGGPRGNSEICDTSWLHCDEIGACQWAQNNDDEKYKLISAPPLPPYNNHHHHHHQPDTLIMRKGQQQKGEEVVAKKKLKI